MAEKEMVKKIRNLIKKEKICFDRDPEKLNFESDEKEVRMSYPQYFF